MRVTSCRCPLRLHRSELSTPALQSPVSPGCPAPNRLNPKVEPTPAKTRLRSEENDRIPPISIALPGQALPPAAVRGVPSVLSSAVQQPRGIKRPESPGRGPSTPSAQQGHIALQQGFQERVCFGPGRFPSSALDYPATDSHPRHRRPAPHRLRLGEPAAPEALDLTTS